MKASKQKLCDAALALFNEKGYDNVSLREIAEAAETTIGNLTYHFPQKELLLLSIQENFQSAFPVQVSFTENPKELLEQLICSFFSAEENEKKNSFYFTNIDELCRVSDKTRHNVEAFRKKLFDYYYIMYASLRDFHVLKSEVAPNAYLNLAYLCVLMTNLWISHASPYHDEALPKINITDSLYYLVKPYLADEYLSTYDDIYQKYRNQ